LELAALQGTDYEIANTLQEPHVLKEYYGLELPHAVMPAGAGAPFFAVAADPRREVLDEHGLTTGRYLLYFGRFSEAKNVPGVVSLFGEARRLDGALMEGVKLVLAGGSPDHPLPEETSVEREIEQTMGEYGLSATDVVRLPNQSWEVLAILAHHCLSYVGMQFVEPFGMGVAESMAASAPTIISKEAGVSRWAEGGQNALVVDPRDPTAAAQSLIESMRQPETLKRIASEGHRLAREKFRWEAIAERQGGIIDEICSKGVGDRERAYHRPTFTWRGDHLELKPEHESAACGLLPYLLEGARKAYLEERRALVVLAGESGAGKTEVAEYLRYLLRGQGIRGVTIPGDAFFRLPPQANHNARLEAYAQGQLEEYLGPGEVDLERLDAVLEEAANLKTDEVHIPCECRRIGSRRYPRAPISLRGVQVILVDLTYGLALASETLKVFLESDFSERIAALGKRHSARDPDQDFTFIRKVLEIEHAVIQGMKETADIIVAPDYSIRRCSLPKEPA
jgi:uridine kinase